MSSKSNHFRRNWYYQFVNKYLFHNNATIKKKQCTWVLVAFVYSMSHKVRALVTQYCFCSILGFTLLMHYFAHILLGCFHWHWDNLVWLWRENHVRISCEILIAVYISLIISDQFGFSKIYAGIYFLLPTEYTNRESPECRSKYLNCFSQTMQHYTAANCLGACASPVLGIVRNSTMMERGLLSGCMLPNGFADDGWNTFHEYILRCFVRPFGWVRESPQKWITDKPLI